VRNARHESGRRSIGDRARATVELQLAPQDGSRPREWRRMTSPGVIDTCWREQSAGKSSSSRSMPAERHWADRGSGRWRERGRYRHYGVVDRDRVWRLSRLESRDRRCWWPERGASVMGQDQSLIAARRTVCTECHPGRLPVAKARCIHAVDCQIESVKQLRRSVGRKRAMPVSWVPPTNGTI